MDKSTQTELEAAAFRRLVSHLQDRTDVQNIDMMNLAGFCRNCLSRWYREAAGEHGIDMEDSAARETVYGMPYAEWKAQYQTEATAEQKQNTTPFTITVKLWHNEPLAQQAFGQGYRQVTTCPNRRFMTGVAKDTYSNTIQVGHLHHGHDPR